MRRVDNSSSQDGIETTSITSSVENEVRRPAASSKSKRNSIKKKIPNFNDDSDDTVNEPLLQSENDISEFNQSAKFVSSKFKTDSTKKISDNTYIDTKVKKTSPTASSSFSGNLIKNVTTDTPSASTAITAPIHNYMNTNIFGAIETTTAKLTKSNLIVEIDNTKSSTHSPSPLIFTTAKIHTDNKAKEMEPLHVTPVPILSTIEGNVIKSMPSTFDSSERQFDIVKFKTDSQNTQSDRQEKEERIIKNVQNIKEHSATISSNIKPTVVSTNTEKVVPGQSTKQAPIDKPLLAQVDSKIPVICSKVEKTNSTNTSLLQDEKALATDADKTKKTISGKSFTEPLKFEIKQKPVKTNNEKQVFLKDESQKRSNGVTPQKVSLNENETIMPSNNSENATNKDKSPNSSSSSSINKQLQRQKKTIEDFPISDDKNQSIACNPKVNISKVESAIYPENKPKSGIINTTIPKTSLQSQDVTILPTKSSNSNYSALSSKPNFIQTVPKETTTKDKTGEVTSVLKDKVGSSVCEPKDKYNISDKSVSSISMPKGKASTTSDKHESLSSITTAKANLADKSNNNKTSSLTSAPSGKVNDFDKSGSSNLPGYLPSSGSTGKVKSVDKPASVTSMPIVKTDTTDKPSSVTSVPLSKANISNKPDSLRSVPSASPKASIKTDNVASLTSMKVNTTEKSPSASDPKEKANITSKPGTTISVPTEKVNIGGKRSSVKSMATEQANLVISKTSASGSENGKKEPVSTTSGSNISKSANTPKSFGKESVVEVKKASEKQKPKISPTLKSVSSIAPSDIKSNKGIPISATANVSSNVVTTMGTKKLESERLAPTSSTATTVIKGSLVSSLPSSSTSAKTPIVTKNKTEPKLSEKK